jgi:hypothetical protein
MDEMLAHFEACLRQLGVAAKVRPATPAQPGIQQTEAHVVRGTSAEDYSLLCGPAVRLTDAARVRDTHRPTLVFTTFVAPKTAETFRRAGVQYLDTAGNAWIMFGDVLVDVRGRPRPDRAARRPRVAAGNLFSAGRAQVVLTLLAWPQLWDAPRRDVAHAAGVSLGQAHNALTLLAESGYGRDHVRPASADLLELWAAAFPTGLATRLTLATYRGESETVRKVNPTDPVFISGEGSAADMLRPATLTLYVEELDPRLAIRNRWRTDGQPNVVVRRKFWHAPDSSDAPLTGLRNAPWPLVYADMLASDDPRVRDGAKEWRARFAGAERHS